MSRLSDVTNAAIAKLLGYYNQTKGVLSMNAGGAATIKSTNAYTFVNNGVLLSHAALAAQSIAVTVGTAYIQPALTKVYYTLGFDSAGAISVAQGSYSGQKLNLDPTKGVGVSQGGTSWVGDGSIPDVADGVTPFGVLEIDTAAATTFTAGTTLLDAVGITVAYHDVSTLPSGTL